MFPGQRRVIKDHRARIEELKIHHRLRMQEVLDLSQNETLSAFKIASKMTWDLKCKSRDKLPVAPKWVATKEVISH